MNSDRSLPAGPTGAYISIGLVFSMSFDAVDGFDGFDVFDTVESIDIIEITDSVDIFESINIIESIDIIDSASGRCLPEDSVIYLWCLPELSGPDCNQSNQLLGKQNMELLANSKRLVNSGKQLTFSYTL